MTTPNGFTTQLWSAIEPIRQAIDTLPFLLELRAGALSLDRFQYYLAQDARYLAVYGRALAAAAAQSTNPDDLIFWSDSAHTTMVVERSLHASWLGDLAQVVEMSPTCTGYTSYLLALAGGGCYPALAAGLLPCFWIYEDVGTRLKESVPDLHSHPYGEWITTYGDPDFAEATVQAKVLVDRVANGSDRATLERMRRAFVTASRYEWMFWDAGYRMETWPI